MDRGEREQKEREGGEGNIKLYVHCTLPRVHTIPLFFFSARAISSSLFRTLVLFFPVRCLVDRPICLITTDTMSITYFLSSYESAI